MRIVTFFIKHLIFANDFTIIPPCKCCLFGGVPLLNLFRCFGSTKVVNFTKKTFLFVISGTYFSKARRETVNKCYTFNKNEGTVLKS